MILELDNFSLSYKNKPLLTDARLCVAEGEFVSIYGPSGSGKTSFVKEIAKLPCAQIVFQQPSLALDPVQKIGKGFEELKKYFGFDADIKALLASVGLGEDILTHLPAQISGGEAQRVNIARALLFSPKLLILDEATSMLDRDTQAEIVALVKKLITGNGGAVLFITHDLEYAREISDRIYFLKGQKFEEQIQ